MKAVALMSDGIDSPVAAYLMACKGVEVVCLSGRNSPDADPEKLKRLVRAVRESSGGNVSLRVFDHYVAQEAIAAVRPKWLHCLLCKRMMVRVASRLGEELDADCIVMGDSLGQVASQTLANIKVVEDAASLPVMRPLIGLDKKEIEAIGREAGTFDISIVGQGVCAYVPKGPSIRGNLSEIERLEGAARITEVLVRLVGTLVEITL